jgi:hypothetical protein
LKQESHDFSHVECQNTETNQKKIQLLVPVYFPGANVRLAFVLNKLFGGDEYYYEAVTVFP